MKLAVTTLFAAFAASFAQEAALTSKQSLKERLVEHRADQFRDNDVRAMNSRNASDGNFDSGI